VAEHGVTGSAFRVDHAAVGKRRRADDIPESKAGKRGFDHILGFHDRNVWPQDRLPVHVMKLGAHDRRAKRLDLDAGPGEPRARISLKALAKALVAAQVALPRQGGWSIPR
jgi:hypothetical protein